LASSIAPRILKQPSLGDDVYPVLPTPSRHDRSHAITLVRSAQERASAMLAEAQREALAILSAAQSERDEQLETLRAGIMADAEREVRERIRVETDNAVLRFNELIEQARVDREGLRAACYADMLALAIAVAELVIGRELRTDPAVVQHVASMALSQVQIEQITHVLVHPNDFAVMARWAASALGSHRGQIEILTDPAVGEGGCVIGTKTGFVDARIETQLSEIRRALAEVVEHV
jgi:flagellar assembly protein FliH